MGASTTTVQWLPGKRFVGIDSTNSVVLSSKDEGVGVRPSDMLLIALASCTAVDVVEILSKKRMALNSMEIITSQEGDFSTYTLRVVARDEQRRPIRHPSFDARYDRLDFTFNVIFVMKNLMLQIL